MTSPPASGRRRPPSLRDVAQIAGVSIKTVSNVVRSYPHVRPETRERVQAAIAQVGYRPQAAAQQLRTGASGLLTAALPSLDHTYFAGFAQALIDEAQQRGQSIVLHSTSGGAEAEYTVLNGFNRVLGDGVIFSPLHIEEARFARMERVSQPTVFVGEHLPDPPPPGSDYVRVDNVAAMRDATAHLLERGRRRVAFLGSIPTAHGQQPHSTGSLRRDGYLRALAERSEAGSPALEPIIQTVPNWMRRDGVGGVAPLLERHPDIDGIVCGNDDLAIGAMARLRELGREVPGDIAVIGYDDTPDAPFASPPLSTISPDLSALATTVLDLLAERIGGYDGPARTVTVPYSLVVRESTAPLDLSRKDPRR